MHRAPQWCFSVREAGIGAKAQNITHEDKAHDKNKADNRCTKRRKSALRKRTRVELLQYIIAGYVTCSIR